MNVADHLDGCAQYKVDGRRQSAEAETVRLPRRRDYCLVQVGKRFQLADELWIDGEHFGLPFLECRILVHVYGRMHSGNRLSGMPPAGKQFERVPEKQTLKVDCATGEEEFPRTDPKFHCPETFRKDGKLNGVFQPARGWKLTQKSLQSRLTRRDDNEKKCY